MMADRPRLAGTWAACVLLLCAAGPAMGLDVAVPFVRADFMWAQGYTGTQADIGVLDLFTADSSHPAISGNFLGSVKLSKGASFVSAHATNVTGTAVSQDSNYPGVAPTAGWWTGQTTNPAGITSIRGLTVATETFGQGLGDLGGNAVDVITFSIGLGGNTTASDEWSLAIDHVVNTNGRTITVAAGNSGPGAATLDGLPTGAFNAIIVGATGGTGAATSEDYTQVADYSSRGPTDDGRAKPDIVAPGSLIHMPTLSGGWTDASGTSFATPMVAGGAALLIDMGRDRGHATDPKVIKSVLLNSADKLAGWSHTSTQPLDYSQGAGQMNLRRAYSQYLPWEQSPGDVGAVGWDTGSIDGSTEDLYAIDVNVPGGRIISATLSWDRIVTTDGEDVEAVDYTFDHLDNLDLYLYDADDLTTPIASSVSTVDNVEHVYFTVAQSGRYVIGVEMTGAAPEDTETFALAWNVLPDPLIPSPPGDVNADGNIDSLDITPLVTALLAADEVAFAEAYPLGNYWAADVNGDYSVDALDITPFVGLFTGGSTVPEPATLLSLALGAVALLGRGRRP